MPSNRPESERAFRKGGRPTKLSQAVTATVVRYLKDGAYIETACAASGVSKTRLYEWLKQARDDDELGLEDTPHQEFRDAVEEALALAELRDLETVSKAAKKGNWTAAAWRLERRNPKRWGPGKRLADDDDSEESNSFTLNYNLDEDGE
jgi:transposase